MEPEGSSPHSQVPAICPYPEPAQSSSHILIPPPEGPSYYYPPIYALVSPAISSARVSPPAPCTLLSLPPYGPHTPPTSLFLILSPAQYWVMSTNLCTNRKDNIVLLDCLCSTQRFLCYWTNTTGMTHLKILNVYPYKSHPATNVTNILSFWACFFFQSDNL